MTCPRAVSVVIPHYGDPAPTLALVASLQRQTGDVDLQVIVSDDSSTEPFPDTAGVTVVRRAVNGGFGSAVNSGAAEAIHERLLILNSDLEVSPTFVMDLMEEAEPWMPAVCGPWIVDHAGNYAWSARCFPTVWHQAVEWLTPLARWRHRRLLHTAVGHDTNARRGEPCAVDWLVGAVLYLPTEVFRGAGGFDEGFFMNSEEVDLQRRLRSEGIPSVLLGQVEVTHAGGGSSGDADRRRRWLTASRLRYADKWGSRRRLQAALSVATIVNLFHNSLRRLAGREVTPVATARAEWELVWQQQRAPR